MCNRNKDFLMTGNYVCMLRALHIHASIIDFYCMYLGPCFTEQILHGFLCYLYSVGILVRDAVLQIFLNCCSGQDSKCAHRICRERLEKEGFTGAC